VLLLLIPASPVNAVDQVHLSFGVVPQQSASKLALSWGPLLAWIENETGISLRFKTAPNIPTFEKRLARGEYDFSYMNPYHYTVFSQKPGYRALAHARDKRINGIIVTRKDAPFQSLDELSGSVVAFPSPAAFAASILTRSEFTNRNIEITPAYVSSHDSVYRSIAKGLYPAGGGVLRTLDALAPEVREQLRILWITPGYTPHAVSAHPRVPVDTITRIQSALVKLDQTQEGRALLDNLKIKGWQRATDHDWDDVRALNIDLLDELISR
jgi:phosphonate transport system substrate-binding protein